MSWGTDGRRSAVGVVRRRCSSLRCDRAHRELGLFPAAPRSVYAGGTKAQFEIRLLSQPMAQVQVALASSDPTEGVPDRTSLTFDEENWFTPQTVIVTGQQDTVAD